jgi:hypothetical protein
MKEQWHPFIQVLVGGGGDSTMCTIYLSTHLAKENQNIIRSSCSSQIQAPLVIIVLLDRNVLQKIRE